MSKDNKLKKIACCWEIESQLPSRSPQASVPAPPASDQTMAMTITHRVLGLSYPD